MRTYCDCKSLHVYYTCTVGYLHKVRYFYTDTFTFDSCKCYLISVLWHNFFLGFKYITICCCVNALDPFSLLNADEDAVIDSILQGMLDKELVKDEFKNDLGFKGDKKDRDPRMKMHMRHQQVTGL